ncbi:MAG: tyrosine-type recombinase/integrase [Candidatus Blackburnbacteria bacterium]|nr:tyrosine-type recombinase/integrase [Candidatus Blackburnbacteria bacterium]
MAVNEITTINSLPTLHREFIQDLQQKSRSSATILAYNKDIEQLVTYFAQNEKTSPQQITPADVEAFRDSLNEKGYTAKSISRKLNAIKAFFRWVVVKKVLENDPAAPVAHPRYENPPPRILSRMEYRALRDAARGDKRIAAIIELMLQTGVRIGEVANLRVEDVKPDSIYIRAYASQPAREVPLNGPAKVSLDEYLKERADAKNDHVFVTKNNRPLLVRNIRSSIDRYFREAGIENAKVNDLRSTFIAHQLKNGVDVVTVSKVAGHKRLSTTERYLEFIDRKNGPGRSTHLEEL